MGPVASGSPLTPSPSGSPSAERRLLVCRQSSHAFETSGSGVSEQSAAADMRVRSGRDVRAASDRALDDRVVAEAVARRPGGSRRMQSCATRGFRAEHESPGRAKSSCGRKNMGINERLLQRCQSVELRVARHTDRLEEVVAFYRDRIGLPELGRFTDHDSYDGVFLGVPGAGSSRDRSGITVALRVRSSLALALVLDQNGIVSIGEPRQPLPRPTRAAVRVDRERG